MLSPSCLQPEVKNSDICYIFLRCLWKSSQERCKRGITDKQPGRREHEASKGVTQHPCPPPHHHTHTHSLSLRLILRGSEACQLVDNAATAAAVAFWTSHKGAANCAGPPHPAPQPPQPPQTSDSLHLSLPLNPPSLRPSVWPSFPRPPPPPPLWWGWRGGGGGVSDGPEVAGSTPSSVPLCPGLCPWHWRH